MALNGKIENVCGVGPFVRGYVVTERREDRLRAATLGVSADCVA